MKKLSLLLTFSLTLSLLSSCYSPRYKNSVYYNSRDDLLILFSYSVPFVRDLDIKMKGHVELYPVEADAFGRTLGILQYNQEKKNLLFGNCAVYCVLQSGSSSESCFYEDVCCVMVENDVDSSETIQQLKQDNDWNMPLDLDRCRKIPIKGDVPSGVYDTSYGYTNYEEIAANALEWDDRTTNFDVLCKDGCGLWLCTLIQDYKDKESPTALIMMREDTSASPKLSICGTRILENRTSPWNEIHAFKQEQGWQFIK